MQKSRDSDSFLAHPRFTFFRKTRLLRSIVREFQRPVEQTIQVNVLPDGLFCRGRLAGLQEISPANFHGRNPHDLSDLIHVPLYGKETLRGPESAKGSMRRRIRRQRFRSNAHARPVIRTASVNGAARQYYRRQSGVGSAVDGELDFASETFSI